ncbi:MAG: pyridoxal phosphate-dependent aminotransferase [Ignavibacteriales bacterium]|nr:pyridoxal phosphate-dependent aminotransferase [Ignavibacteriales bacterium]
MAPESVVEAKPVRSGRSEPPALRLSHRAGEMQASPLRKLAAIAEERKRKGIRVYHLNIGQPDLPTPPVVFETIRALNQKTLSYAPSNGIPEALEAWQKYLTHCGIAVDQKEIIVTAGGSEAIIFAMCAVCDAGDELIVFEPFYTNYNGFATIANVVLRPVPLDIASGFHLPSAGAIERFITKRTRGFLFCNPSNPTGTVYSREEVGTLVSLARQHGLFLLSDEVYREFTYEGTAHSIMSFPEVADQAILLDSTSKRFNVCGARIGALVSHNAEIVQTAFKFGMARLSVATVEQHALVPLLSSPKQFTGPIAAEFRRRRDLVYDKLAEIEGVTYYKPEGAFYIVIGLPVKDSDHFARWLIEEYQHQNETVLLAPAQGFYATPGKGLNEVRLAFMLNGEALERSLVILREALQTYSEKFR